MAQNTNAEALIQLRPLQNTNYGAIIEEHTRYWKAIKDKEEADKLAREAQQQALNQKREEASAKRFDELVKGISIADSNGYFRHQIVQDFEREKPYLYQLALKASQNDTDARFQLDNKLREYADKVSLDKLYQEKVKTINDSALDYNEALDKDDLSFMEDISNSKWAFKNGKIITPNNEYSVSELKNRINELKFSGNFDFNKIGSEIAKTIIPDDINGNIKPDRQNQIEGIRASRDLLVSNPNLLKTWAYNQGVVREEYDDVQIRDLAISFYTRNVETALKYKDNSLSNQKDNSTLANQALERKKKQEELEETSIELTIADDKDGNILKTDFRKGDFEDFNEAVQDATIINIKGTKNAREVKDEKGTAITYTHLVRNDKTGDILAFGKQLNEYDEVVPVVIRSATELNTLAGSLFGLDSYSELSDKVDELLGNKIQESNEAEGDKIFGN